MNAEPPPDWLSDPSAQRRTREAINATAAAWQRGWVHRQFSNAMAAHPGPGADAVVDAVRSLFSDRAWLDHLVGLLADAMRADRHFEPPFRPLNSDVHQGLIVFEDDRVTIAAGVTCAARLAAKKTAERGRTSIAFSGQVEIFKILRGAGTRLVFWEAPEITDRFTADRAGRCRPAGDRILEQGELLVVDGRRRSFVIDHVPSNLALLQATVKADRAPVSVEYDSETHTYVGCSAADDSASRVQMLTTLLRKLDHRDAFPAIAGFLDHPHFFVRWHVIRELLGIDAEAAMPHLKRMAARDPHDEVRSAARSLLDRIEGGTASRKAA